MKKTVTVAIGGRSFTLDEDAYNALGTYLDNFRDGVKSAKDGSAFSAPEVMEELEMRIGDLFQEQLKGREVVEIDMVENVISQLGMPDWTFAEDTGKGSTRQEPQPVRKFFRDTDNNMIGGVCSGLALYLNIDVVILRVFFVIALFMGSAGFWIYLIFCLIAPAARTAAEKCELRGLPVTAENIRRFSKK